MNATTKERTNFKPKFISIDIIFTAFMGGVFSTIFIFMIALNINNISPFDVESLIGSVLIFVAGVNYYNFKSYFYRLVVLAIGTDMIILAQFYAHIFTFNTSLFVDKFIIVILPIVVSAIIYLFNFSRKMIYNRHKSQQK